VLCAARYKKDFGSDSRKAFSRSSADLSKVSIIVGAVSV
jgi:hypothetical protein